MTTDQYRMSESFELPRPYDFCRNRMTDHRGSKFCSLGWFEELASKHPELAPHYPDFLVGYRAEARRLNMRGAWTDLPSITKMNDDFANGFDQICSCFHAGIRECGYEV
jgi:hypothetical protein